MSNDKPVRAMIAFSVAPETNLGRICSAIEYGDYCRIVIDDDDGHHEIPLFDPRPGKFLTDGRRRLTDDNDDGLPLSAYEDDDT